MNERQKSYFALLIVFLALLVIGFIEAAFGKETNSPTPFQEQVAWEVGQVLKHRDGVLLWQDHKTSTEKVFGNPELLDKNFRPGSLMKLITAETALQEGIRQNYRCRGRDKIGGKKHFCWTPKGHGLQDLAQALGKSCNLYFSKLAQKIGGEKILQALRAYPFTHAQNFSRDLLSEPSDLADLAIGDHPAFKVTPREMAEFWQLYLNKLTRPGYQVIRQGLLRAVSGGTARGMGSLPKGVLAKTGTSDAESVDYKTDGWFLGAYPAENPQYTLLIFLKNSHGYLEPTQLAAKIFAHQESLAEMKNP